MEFDKECFDVGIDLFLLLFFGFGFLLLLEAKSCFLAGEVGLALLHLLLL
jgi:hypothetical protein